MDIKKYLKVDNICKDFLPNVKNRKHKMRGKNGRGNALSFSNEETEQIKNTLRGFLDKKWEW